MAILTSLSHQELARAASAFGVELAASRPVLAGSVNTNYELTDTAGQRWFLRVYEEQGVAGARREARLLTRLNEQGVATPPPRRLQDEDGFVTSVRDKPAVLFTFAPGEHRCQARVSGPDVFAVGEQLARIHRVAERWSEADRATLTGPSRFDIAALAERLNGLSRTSLSDEMRRDRERLSARLAELSAREQAAASIPLVHGDLFRDNVLFSSDRIWLLDFESASRGSAAFDLAVTALAWCFGADFSHTLFAELQRGYSCVRELSAEERQDLPWNLRLACVRFATTRMTDYELRPHGLGVYKDYRRWLARLEAVDRFA